MNQPRGGFSLLELVLAIGLSIALATLLGFAINLHLVRLDSSRTTIEQAQVARALLDRIADDLRAVTTVPTQDVSDLLAAAEATATFDVDEIDQSASNADNSNDDQATTEEPPPGLYGTIDSVQLDRRRTRLSLTTFELGSLPTPRIDAGWSQVTYRLSIDSTSPGLVRTETARDIARWQTEQGETAAFVEPLASEVRTLRFRYLDGEQLVESWDMAEQERLPEAVEVFIELQPADADPSAPEVRRKPQAYRRFVRLPSASEEPIDQGAGTVEASDVEAP